MPKKRRLIWQLYPYFLLIILISIIAVTWYASRSLKDFFLNQIRADLEARLYIFKNQVLNHLDPPNPEALDALCKQIGRSAATRFTIILPSGKVVGDTHEDPSKMDNHADRVEILKAVTGSTGSSLRYSLTLEKNMMYVAVSHKKGNRTLAVIRASIPVDPVDEAINRVRNRITAGALMIAILGAVVSYLVSRRITRPIKEIQVGAECFSRGEFDCRLPSSDFEEIAGLSESMNRMAEELQVRINTITRQRNRYEAVLSSMVEGVIALDTDERVISMNQAACRILKCDPEQVVGRSIQEVARNTDLQNFVKTAFAGSKFVEREIVITSERDLILNGHGTILMDERGERMGVLIVLNDVTRLKKLENIRRDFVANVSHEIKTPITAIKGFTETLHDGAMNDPKDAKRFLKIIRKHVDRLEAIIEDLLSLSRIEQGVENEKIVLKRSPIREILSTAVQVCQVKAAPKKISIALDCDTELTARVNPALLEQAVVNLLDNAVKYSDEGGAIRIGAVDKGDEIEIAVQDEGCGIEKRHLSRLFERFYRVDKARSRHLGGTGLGLAIVKHIIQAHGGRISVDSTPGKGSSFTLHLPGN